MNFPVFSQLARKLGFRDEFAPDCLLQQRVCELSVSVWARRGSRARATPSRSLPPANYLAVSVGSDNGAFAAGLLVGWSDSGTRPSSNLVSGISTSALAAHFFVSGGPPLGGARDPLFRRFSRHFR